jgi:serine/threonine protein kinase/Flp pilus assembly protein TadD
MSAFGQSSVSVETAPTESAFAPPVIPDHELLRHIGRGSYGEVWLARNVLGSFRAVKVVYRKSFDHDKPYEREFEGLKKFEPISHARETQVDIFHVGRNDEAGFFYYIMELADGVGATLSSEFQVSGSEGTILQAGNSKPKTYQPRTLKHDLRVRGALPVTECVKIGLSLTSALEHLHSYGLVHRDIKPSNIIFVKGVPKLADIGLVTNVDATRSFVGTDGYIPPEGPGTPQADLYSLGKVLYECVTGKDRFDFPELPADWRTRPDFAQLLEFNEILTKACDSEPKQRYQSAEEMRAESERLKDGQSLKRQRQWQKCAKRTRQAALPVMGLAFLASVVALVLHSSQDHYIRSSKAKVNELVEQGNSVILSGPSARYRQAFDYFKEAIDLDPKFVPAYFGLFRTQVQLEGPAALRATAEKMMSFAPSKAESRGALALIKWYDWKFAEALADARLATKLSADSREGEAYAYLAYGFFLMETGSPVEAEREFWKGEKLFPSDPFIHDHLGSTYLMRSNFVEALKHYQKSIELAPGHMNGLTWMGRTYEEMEDFDKAIKTFEQHDRLANTDEDKRTKRYAELRRAFEQGGRDGYWRKRLEQALKESPPNLYRIAALFARVGQKNDAYEYLEKACEQHAFTEGPMFDLCWDHNDERFKAIVKRIGLIQ